MIIQNYPEGLACFQWKFNDCMLSRFLRLVFYDLKPSLMKEICYRSANLTQEEEILYIYSQNTIKFGNKSLR